MSDKNKDYRVVPNYCGSKDYVVIHNPERGIMTEKEAYNKARRLNSSYDYCSV